MQEPPPTAARAKKIEKALSFTRYSRMPVLRARCTVWLDRLASALYVFMTVF
jgi:hypothetical protein